MAGSRTPAYGADGGRTVNPYADGNRTVYGNAGGVRPFHTHFQVSHLIRVTEDPSLGCRCPHLLRRRRYHRPQRRLFRWLQNALRRLRRRRRRFQDARLRVRVLPHPRVLLILPRRPMALQQRSSLRCSHTGKRYQHGSYASEWLFGCDARCRGADPEVFGIWRRCADAWGCAYTV